MLKQLAYRAACTHPGSVFVAQLGRLVDVPELPRRALPQRHPFDVIVTIDTEGGYVRSDERRIWQGREPEAFQGYVDGVRNVLEVLARHRAKATFLVSPHGLSARGSTRVAVEGVLARILAEGHEIGLHLHPMSDRATTAVLGKTFSSPTAHALAPDDRLALLRAGKRLLEESTGARLTSFRWGNWALDRESACSVADAGFRVDSSAVPRLRDRAGDRYDWSASGERVPWMIAPSLVEVPIATYRVGPMWLRADPLYGPLLDAAFERYRAHAPRETGPFPFVVMTHSTEATYRDGAPTRALRALDRFLGYALAFEDVRAGRLDDVSRGGA